MKNPIAVSNDKSILTSHNPRNISARSSSSAPAIATSSKASLWTGQDFPLCPRCMTNPCSRRDDFKKHLPSHIWIWWKGKDMWLDKPQPLHQTEPLKQSVQRRMPGRKEQLVHLTPTPLASLSKSSERYCGRRSNHSRRKAF